MERFEEIFLFFFFLSIFFKEGTRLPLSFIVFIWWLGSFRPLRDKVKGDAIKDKQYINEILPVLSPVVDSETPLTSARKPTFKSSKCEGKSD